MKESFKKYPLLWWRPFYDIGICYAIIFACAYLCCRWPLLSIVLVFVIANRQLALSLICHEALHGTLFINKKINNFVGRWFCGFPTWVSFSKYKKLHMLHHAGLGTKLDPDVHLYQAYPMSKLQYFKAQFFSLIQLKTMFRFLSYYTDILDLKNISFKKSSKIYFKKWISGDFFEFILFYFILIVMLIKLNLYVEYFLFYLLPLLVIVQPYVWIMGGLQHGPIPSSQNQKLLSRTIVAKKWLAEIILPLDINFHAEHHFNASVPHYWLKQYSLDLSKNGKNFWHQSYAESLKELFSSSSNFKK